MSNLLELNTLHQLVKYVVLPAHDPHSILDQALSQLWFDVDTNSTLSSLHNLSSDSDDKLDVIKSDTNSDVTTDLILQHQPNILIDPSYYDYSFLQQPYAELFTQYYGFNLSWLSHNYYFVWQAYRSQAITEYDLAPVLELLPSNLNLDQVLETLVTSGILGLGKLCANFDSVFDCSKLKVGEADFYAAVLQRLAHLILTLDLQAQTQLTNQAYTWANAKGFVKQGIVVYDQVLDYLATNFNSLGHLLSIQRLALFFNLFRAQTTSVRLPLDQALINQAVTYRQVYLQLAQNSQISDQDYIFLANGNVHLSPDWRIRLNQLLKGLPQLSSPLGTADIVQLMHTLEPRTSNYQLTLLPESGLSNVYTISNRLGFTADNLNLTTNYTNTNNSNIHHTSINYTSTNLTNNLELTTNSPNSALQFSSIKAYKENYVTLAQSQALTHNATSLLKTGSLGNDLYELKASLGSAYLQSANNNYVDPYFLEHSSLAHQSADLDSFKSFKAYVDYLASSNLSHKDLMHRLVFFTKQPGFKHLSLSDLSEIVNYYRHLPSLLAYAAHANTRMYQQFDQYRHTEANIYDQASGHNPYHSDSNLRQQYLGYSDGLHTTPFWGLATTSNAALLDRTLNLANIDQQQAKFEHKVVTPLGFKTIALTNYSNKYVDVFGHNYYQSYHCDLYLNRRYLDLLRLPTINLPSFASYTVETRRNVVTNRLSDLGADLDRPQHLVQVNNQNVASNLESNLETNLTSNNIGSNNTGSRNHSNLNFPIQANSNYSSDNVLIGYHNLAQLQLYPQVQTLSVEQLKQQGLNYQVLTPTNLFYHQQLTTSFTISGEILGNAIPNFATQSLYYLDKYNFSSSDCLLFRKSVLKTNLKEEVSYTASQFLAPSFDLNNHKIVHLSPSLAYTTIQNQHSYLSPKAVDRLHLESCLSLDLDYDQSQVQLGYDYVSCYQRYILSYLPNFTASLTLDGRLTDQDIASYTHQQPASPYYQNFAQFFVQDVAKTFTPFSPQGSNQEHKLWEQASYSNQQQLYKSVQDLIHLTLCQVCQLSPQAQSLDLITTPLTQELVTEILSSCLDIHTVSITTEQVTAQIHVCYHALEHLAQALETNTKVDSKLELDLTSTTKQAIPSDYHQRFSLLTLVRLALSLERQEFAEVCLELVHMAKAYMRVRDYQLINSVSPTTNHYLQLSNLSSLTLLKLQAAQQLCQKLLADTSIFEQDYVLISSLDYKFSDDWKTQVNRVFSYLHNTNNIFPAILTHLKSIATLVHHHKVLVFKFNDSSELTHANPTTNYHTVANANATTNSTVITPVQHQYDLPSLDIASCQYLQQTSTYAQPQLQAQLTSLTKPLSLTTVQASLVQVLMADCFALSKSVLQQVIWQEFMHMSSDDLAILAHYMASKQTHKLLLNVVPSLEHLISSCLVKAVPILEVK